MVNDEIMNDFVLRVKLGFEAKDILLFNKAFKIWCMEYHEKNDGILFVKEE